MTDSMHAFIPSEYADNWCGYTYSTTTIIEGVRYHKSEICGLPPDDDLHDERARPPEQRGSGLLSTARYIDDINTIVRSASTSIIDQQRALCPKGFVPAEGFGNQRTCKTCRRPLGEHMVVVQ